MISRIRISLCVFPALLFSISLANGAENGVPVWQRYDESADLAQLASHENESMRFRLLNSKVLDKNSLWAPFEEKLGAISNSDYESLKALILERPISFLQQAVADGRLDYETLTSFYIYRIREIESDDRRFLNGVISLNPDAIDRARRLDVLREQGREISPDSMFGIPVLLKDNIGVAGMPTTAGAIALQDNMAANAFVAERLLENGAIILGKANLSEWAYFFCNNCPSGYSAMGGQTLNPYGRLEFGTGGSSSGSGASVAANYATVAVGSETTGSILSPASSNSLVGLKPTTGSLSRSGVVPISSTLDTTGPMTRSVADAVVLFNAMAGYDQQDPAMPLLSGDLQLQYRNNSLAGKRLGAVISYAEDEYYQSVLSVMSADGGDIVEIEMSEYRNPDFMNLLGGEMVRDLASYLEQYAHDDVSIESINSLRAFNNQDLDLRAPYGQGLVEMMDELNLPAEELESIRASLQATAREIMEALFSESRLDVVLSVNNHHSTIAALANYPVLTIPMGYGDDGRPVGLSLIAPSFEEQTLIDVGARFEQLTRARVIPGDYQ